MLYRRQIKEDNKIKIDKENGQQEFLGVSRARRKEQGGISKEGREDSKVGQGEGRKKKAKRVAVGLITSPGTGVEQVHGGLTFPCSVT